MKYSQLAENREINDSIYRYFEYIRDEDIRKFVKKFGEQPHNENQVLHTFRELILGAFLASNGFKVQYDREIDGKTPDWSIFSDAAELQGIVELTNFHPDKTTENTIMQELKTGNIYCDWQPNNNDRLYQRIQEKADHYENLIRTHNVPYTVAVFGEFTAAVELDELNECLFKDHGGGLFRQCPALSGVLFFQESAGQYIFKYIKNSQPENAINLPSGVF